MAVGSFFEQHGSTLAVAAAVATGLIGGVFFAFSSFVMRALAMLPPTQGISAMQAINVAAVTPAFMGALFGTAALCLAAGLVSITHWQRPGMGYLLAGSLCYLAGAILTTAIFNVPLNNALAVADPTSSAGVTLWSSFQTTWTAWNHLRAAGSILAAVIFTLAFNRMR